VLDNLPILGATLTSYYYSSYYHFLSVTAFKKVMPARSRAVKTTNKG